MSKKKGMIIKASAVAGMAVVSIGLAFSIRGDKGPDFAGMKTEEVKAYFYSDAFRRLNERDQRAIKERAYGPLARQAEQKFFEQARIYSQLPPQQKGRFLDARINEWIQAAEPKQEYAARNTTGAAAGAGTRGGRVDTAQSSAPKKTVISEDYRAWSERMDPEERAYIMAFKEALRERMEQRGYDIGRGK